MNAEERAELQREEARIAEAFTRLEKERDAAVDAKRRAERERDLMGRRIEQGRAAAVVYVERITEVEAERDTVREQAERLRLCWKSARRGRAKARAELATWQAAGQTTDLEGDVGDHLSDLAEWETENATVPEWLVKAVVELLAPIAAERDRLARERDGLARADKAGQRWASGRIDALEEKVHRVRQVHAPQCGGGCAAVPCECGPGDLVCAECGTPAPCATERALDGTEPAS